MDSLSAENLNAWLNPDPKKSVARYANPDDRWRSHDVHRLAA